MHGFCRYSICTASAEACALILMYNIWGISGQIEQPRLLIKLLFAQLNYVVEVVVVQMWFMLYLHLESATPNPHWISAAANKQWLGSTDKNQETFLLKGFALLQRFRSILTRIINVWPLLFSTLHELLEVVAVRVWKVSTCSVSAGLFSTTFSAVVCTGWLSCCRTNSLRNKQQSVSSTLWKYEETTNWSEIPNLTCGYNQRQIWL